MAYAIANSVTRIEWTVWLVTKTKTTTKKPLFYLDNKFNNLLIFNTVETKT